MLWRLIVKNATLARLDRMEVHLSSMKTVLMCQGAIDHKLELPPNIHIST